MTKFDPLLPEDFLDRTSEQLNQLRRKSSCLDEEITGLLEAKDRVDSVIRYLESIASLSQVDESQVTPEEASPIKKAGYRRVRQYGSLRPKTKIRGTYIPGDVIAVSMNRKSGVKAQAVFLDGELTVRKGSQAEPDIGELGNGKEIVIGHRDNLRERMLLVEDGETLLFSKDVTFDNPSLAAKIVSGRSLNGWDVWKCKDGRTLGDAIDRF